MYETEINSAVESGSALPPEILRRFEDLRGRIAARTVLPWSEHCTECVWPTCYTSCDLYSPRPDGRCRRFSEGMVRVEAPAVNSYILKIRFKRWGKLWTPGNIRLLSARAAGRRESRDYRMASLLHAAPLPSLVKITAAKKRYGFKKRAANSPASSPEMPASFLMECYNPASRTVALSLSMRAVDTESAPIPFQKLIPLSPGFHRIRIPVKEIAAFLDLRRPFGIDLIPDEDLAETTLYFGLLDFVSEMPVSEIPVSEVAVSGAAASPAEPVEKNQNKSQEETQKKVKCVVWDLDHTLWDGVLVEDGADRLRLKPGIAELIQTLDQRGILHSIASKNNPEEALHALRNFGLEEYFLCPQISWNPKSQAIQEIARQLNIGMDTLLFLDDSSFELEEVRRACPAVRVLSAEHYRELAQRPEFQVPVTAESRERRLLYQVEASRQAVAENFSHDYMAFLRHSQIQLSVASMREENLERVHELTQRTNQMNFSGNRYDRAVLRQLLGNPHLDTFVLSCQDRFGSYGVVGFSVVDRREPRMIDLMFSCRIQSKRVEHAFLSWLLRKYLSETGKDFHANYRKTPRNAPSGKVFDDFGMAEQSQHDGVLSLLFSRENTVPDDGVISVIFLDNVANSSAKNGPEKNDDPGQNGNNNSPLAMQETSA
jgi:FkbH-like protein